MEGSQSPAPAELLGRVTVSIAVCVLLSWQLAETYSSSRRARGAGFAGRSCGCFAGSPLQWYLLTLMLLSVLEGVVGVVSDLLLLSPDGSLPLSAIREEVGLSIALGRVGDAIISLMVIGLGVDAWLLLQLPYSRFAVVLGFASLLSRRLPAPLVLVAGVSCLQRSPEPARGEDENGSQKCNCCSLRFVLRPLLALALLEMLYATIASRAAHDKLFVEHMQEAQRKVVMDTTDQGGDRETVMRVLEQVQPVQLLELAEVQVGELVMFGVVVALGLSGHAHGLRYVRLPVAAALVPGLPTPFAVVFYFLLETRQKHAGGTLLPLHSPRSEKDAG